MNNYLASVNAGYFYLIVAAVLAFITVMCIIFAVKSYRAGLSIGMEKTKLKKYLSNDIKKLSLQKKWRNLF